MASRRCFPVDYHKLQYLLFIVAESAPQQRSYPLNSAAVAGGSIARCDVGDDIILARGARAYLHKIWDTSSGVPALTRALAAAAAAATAAQYQRSSPLGAITC